MLSKTALSVVKALVYLADQPEGAYVGVGEIAKNIGAGQNYLGKILQFMTHEELVQSQKGLGGGFRLARPAKEICLFDAVDPIDHVSRWDGCFLTHGSCTADHPCTIHDKWRNVRRTYLDFLKNTTIAELSHPGSIQISIPK